MRIGIDARLYSQTGVGRYIRNLISQLAFIDKKNEYFIYFLSEDYDKFLLPNNRWHKKILNVKWHTIKEQIYVPFYLLRDNLDLVHFPYFNVPILYPKKYLLTIHDLIIDHFDTGSASTLPAILYKIKRLGYRITTNIGIRKASYISVISETTKKEVVDHYSINPSLLAITYDAIDTNFFNLHKSIKPINFYKFKYILYVGNAYPHKNLERFILAFKQVRRKHNVSLVLAGDDWYFYPRLKQIVKNLGLDKSVIFFGNADDKQLINLYSFARCLVFPSLMEGFGLPNLEAILCGCYPIISNISVFHEIWGDDLIYLDPYNINDIQNKIIDVLNLPMDEYKKRVVIARKRINIFSWRQTAIDTLKLYQKIII